MLRARMVSSERQAIRYELVPEAALAQSGADKTRRAFAHVPVAEPAELAQADAIIFGTPTRFGMMCSQMRNFLDRTSQLWVRGELVGDLLGRSVLVEGRRLALLHGERALGAYGEAEAGAVAQLLLHDLGLAVDDLDRAFGARGDTEAAPVTQLFVDLHDTADWHALLAFARFSR